MKKRMISLLVCLSLILAMAPALSLPAAASANGHTQAEAVAWTNSQIGKYLDYDGKWGAQCWDLIKYYYVYLGNGSYAVGNATDFQSNKLPSGWTRVKSNPQPGDVIVWGGGTKGGPGWTVDKNGHVGIVTAVNGDKLTTVEQNINGSPCKTAARSASYATCFIRPDFTSDKILTINHNVNGGTLNSADFTVNAAGIVQKDGQDVTTKWAYGTGGEQYGLWNASSFGLTREGCTFIGWALSQDGSGAIFDQDDTTLKAEDIYPQLKDGSASVTLYAVWQPADTAVYVISPKCAPDSCLDVQGEGRYNGANVLIWAYKSAKNQQWAIIPVGDGWYKLMPQHSPKALDVAGQGTTAGTNVQQYIYAEQHDAQKWRLEEAGDGYYYIVPKGNTGLCLDVYDAGAENGTNVQVYTRNGSDAQKWKLTLVGGTPEADKPAEVQAMPTNDKLTADGRVQNATVYKINGSNYFKIRDLAAILNGTDKQFEVGYDGGTKSVTADTGRAYTSNGTELKGAPAGGNKTAMASNDTIYINGAEADVEVYKIDGSNYFKLRDLGKALNFYVGWTKESGMFIDTGRPYSE